MTYNRKQFLEDHQKLTELMHETTKKKNADYSGGSDDPFFNFRAVERIGIADAGTAIMVRISDKIARITSALKGKELQVKDEMVEDTCIDLVNYAIILGLWFKANKAEQEAIRIVLKDKVVTSTVKPAK